MSGETEQLLLRRTRLPDTEILVAGHHGSKYSTSRELLQAADPELVLISVGEDNRYGHPAPETLARLGEREVHRTDREGSITVTFSRGGVDFT
jgi:competence protein ComEC